MQATAPSSAAAGGTASIGWTIKNQGGGSAAASNVKFYLSVNSIVDSNDVLLTQVGPAPGLDPGVSSPGSTTVSIPSNTTAGTYYLIASADGDNSVLETNETNNSLPRFVSIGGDLVISSLTVPPQVGAGAVIISSGIPSRPW